MLHQVPNSDYHDRLLEVFEMQKDLFKALCALSSGSRIDLDWLQSIWSSLGNNVWCERFWNLDSGKRAQWCKEIAAAEDTTKQELIAIMEEQHRFAELYSDPPSIRLEIHSWKISKNATGATRARQIVMKATQNLLECFYAPLLYKKEGFPNTDGSKFNKDAFIGQPPKVCPYSDDKIQDTKLDHFLPKERFPFLSVHPDNLIPCSTDSNSGGNKGAKLPISREDNDQAKEWFHPKLRSAMGKYGLNFDEPNDLGPKVQFIANSPADQPRLDNMEKMFGLSEFWSRDLNDELQMIASDIESEIQNEGLCLSANVIRTKLTNKVTNTKRRIGFDALAIVNSAFYQHIINTPVLFKQVERICNEGT